MHGSMTHPAWKEDVGVSTYALRALYICILTQEAVGLIHDFFACRSNWNINHIFGIMALTAID